MDKIAAVTDAVAAAVAEAATFATEAATAARAAVAATMAATFATTRLAASSTPYLTSTGLTSNVTDYSNTVYDLFLPHLHKADDLCVLFFPNVHLTAFVTPDTLPFYLLPIMVILSPLILTFLSSLLAMLFFASTWLFWISLSTLTMAVQVTYVAFNFLMIVLSISILSFLKGLNVVHRHTIGRSLRTQRSQWRSKLDTFIDYEQFKKGMAKLLSFQANAQANAPLSNKSNTRGRTGRQPRPISRTLSLSDLTAASNNSTPSPLTTLQTAITTLTSSLHSSPLPTLLQTLPHYCQRNHLSAIDILLSHSRHIATDGGAALDVTMTATANAATQLLDRTTEGVRKVTAIAGTKSEKQGVLAALRGVSHNVGRTALMLSGGGSITMYHLGTVKALIEGGLYEKIGVVSGTSGGSIAAAMCAVCTQEELIKYVCVKEVSTNYRGRGREDGEQGRKDIRWFPRLESMGLYWLKSKLLVPSKEFRRCCYWHYGDLTFEEAFKKTNKTVCITVSASRAVSGSGVQRLLLNHVSTPHVTVASAVAASCALPGVMAPTSLDVKIGGVVSKFEVDGVEWIDGSVQADLPFKRISTLFNVTNFVVAQVNFHVVPLINKAYHPGEKSLFWRMLQACEWDVRSRVLNLSRLGLFPRFFGQDVSKVFSQKYTGDVTIVPRMNVAQVVGAKALLNPTVEDMEHYLQNGQSAAWPYLQLIGNMVALESVLKESVSRLEGELGLKTVSVGGMIVGFEGGGGERSVSRGVAGRELETMRTRLEELEGENERLRSRVAELEGGGGEVVGGEVVVEEQITIEPAIETEGETWETVTRGKNSKGRVGSAS